MRLNLQPQDYLISIERAMRAQIVHKENGRYRP